MSRREHVAILIAEVSEASSLACARLALARAAAHGGRVGTVYDVGASSEVAERGRLVVEIDGAVTLGVFRFRGELRAYENVCAHQGGPACQGRVVARVTERLDAQMRSHGLAFVEDTMHIVCPWHGYEYDVVTGRHPGRPEMALRSFPVEESEGRIRVTV